MESETQTTPTAAARSVANPSQRILRLLVATMAVESLLVIGLTLRDFSLSTTLSRIPGTSSAIAMGALPIAEAAIATPTTSPRIIALSLPTSSKP